MITQRQPDQPDVSRRAFIDELKSPLYPQPFGFKERSARPNEACLAGGVTIDARFADPDKLLATAYRDLNRFLKAAGISRKGGYQIITDQVRTQTPETFRLEVGKKKCRILAADTEGIRRGIFFLEDRIRRANGPFLPVGKTERVPVIRTRISRCFFSPIKCPPLWLDELSDATDYFPEAYLDRLAHHGINGLWIRSAFRELCSSKIIPELNEDNSFRLKKLRSIVKRCARYGIKIYIFAIEPAAFCDNNPALLPTSILDAHPDLAGHRIEGWDTIYFCGNSPKGQAYLEEATRTLFSSVPGLGGFITISVGERPSHCYSGRARQDHPVNCPICSKLGYAKALANVLAAMRRGIDAVNPDAELISWPYTQLMVWNEQRTRETAGKVPTGVILQHNFESGAETRQLGRRHKLWDYWLSYAGPNKLFRDCAKAALKNGTRVSAKLQVSTSLEVASVPFVPVPGNLYRKYKAMHELGVSMAMQCWTIPGCPSMMSKAAGELSFKPFPKTEDAFLLELAKIDWADHAADVARAWKYFGKGYRNYPQNYIFSYYGPMWRGPVWPLHLTPVDKPLAQNWLLRYLDTGELLEPSGDRIGECLTYENTLEEAIVLCRRMSDNWNKGVAIMKKLLPDYQAQPERVKDIGVATALGLHFRSGVHILSFYNLREALPFQKKERQLETLNQMRAIVEDELRVDEELLPLCHLDSRIGFSTPGEGYDYFPEKITWRMDGLRSLLDKDFPRVEETIKRGKPLFPKYTGTTPVGAKYHCKRLPKTPRLNGKPVGPIWDRLDDADFGFSNAADYARRMKTTWKAGYNNKALYIGVVCDDSEPDEITSPFSDGVLQPSVKYSAGDAIDIRIEPKRLWLSKGFAVSPNGSRYHANGGLGYTEYKDYRWTVKTHKSATGWSATIRIPIECLEPGTLGGRPMRINVIRYLSQRQRQPRARTSWIKLRPIPDRLAIGAENPKDFGWLIFKQ